MSFGFFDDSSCCDAAISAVRSQLHSQSKNRRIEATSKFKRALDSHATREEAIGIMKSTARSVATIACVLALNFSDRASAFSHDKPSISTPTPKTTKNDASVNNQQLSRRSAMISAASLLGGAMLSAEAANAETRQGIELTPFNSLAFQYRNSGNGGLDASAIDEPSIPYADFLSKLTSGDVEFVEFLAPDGDIAYATLKPTEGGAKTRIRIGEGFPTEDHEGWSSPAFAIKSVKKSNVPYKFIVPGLDVYKSM